MLILGGEIAGNDKGGLDARLKPLQPNTNLRMHLVEKQKDYISSNKIIMLNE